MITNGLTPDYITEERRNGLSNMQSHKIAGTNLRSFGSVVPNMGVMTLLSRDVHEIQSTRPFLKWQNSHEKTITHKCGGEKPKLWYLPPEET